MPAPPAVTSACDGAEALRLLRSSAPDTFQLVLTVSAAAPLALATACRPCSAWPPPLNTPFPLALQDVCMPELNGIQLLSCLKQDANLRSVPVVSESPPPSFLARHPRLLHPSSSSSGLRTDPASLLLSSPSPPQ